MPALAAYFDDSGSHKDSPVVCVAGAAASISQWTKFSRLWDRHLRRHHLECFHMTDFVSGHGPYRDWDKSKKSWVLSDLVRTIKSNVQFLAGNAVFRKDFQAAIAKHPNPCVRDEYHFCALLNIPALGLWKLESNNREPIRMYFASGNKLMNRHVRLIQADFTVPENQAAYGIAGIDVASKRDAPLQAADVIVYGTYKCRAQRRIEPYLSAACESLFRIRNVGIVHTQKMIENALAHITDDLVARAHLYKDIFGNNSR
jgi:hypothetical protein